MILLGINDLARREQARSCWPGERSGTGGCLLAADRGRGAGKPWFPACPQRYFNLSHSGKLALCALADGEVGVDVQEMRAAWRPSWWSVPAVRTACGGGGGARKSSG